MFGITWYGNLLFTHKYCEIDNYGSTMNDEKLASELKCAIKMRHTWDFEDIVQNK